MGLGGPKKRNIGPPKGSKHKIASYEAKWDFKVLKIPSWVLKLVFYLFNRSVRSIYLTADSREKNKSFRGIFLTAVTGPLKGQK